MAKLMGNKDSVLWTWTLIGILVFLPGKDCKSGFGEICETNSDCKTKWCLDSGTCGCPYKHKLIQQYFDENKQKCVSAVGKACTFEGRHAHQNHKSMPTLECIEHAVCQRLRSGPVSKSIFGECTCKEGYLQSQDHLCKLPHQHRTAEGRVHKADENYIRPMKEDDVWTSLSMSIASPVNTDTRSFVAICVLVALYFWHRVLLM